MIQVIGLVVGIYCFVRLLVILTGLHYPFAIRALAGIGAIAVFVLTVLHLTYHLSGPIQ